MCSTIQTFKETKGRVNDNKVYRIWYIIVFVEMTKSAKNIKELVLENILILAFLLVNTSSKQ